MKKTTKRWIGIALLIAAGAGLTATWQYFNQPVVPESFAMGNGRIEATEVNVATKLPGRVAVVLAKEGDMVESGQVLARLDTNEIQAQLEQAEAIVAQRRQEKAFAEAKVMQRESQLTLTEKTLARSESLYENRSVSLERLQQDETAVQTARAALVAARAQVVSAGAAISAAIAQAKTIQVNLDDSVLVAPTRGRVLYRLAEPGEVLGTGGGVITLLDLSAVYMTLFLPTAQAGVVALGAESRIVLDALPETAIPATVTFVAPRSQFTPREVETQTEREKLMFRIKVTIDPGLIAENIERVKTGLPGVAYVRLDADTAWPQELQFTPSTP